MSEVSSGIREPARRYGNLREPKLPGFGRLSAGASLFLVLAAVVLMVLCLVSLVAGLVWAVVALVVVTPAAFPRADGYGRYEAWWRARRFSAAQRAGRTRLMQGVAGATPDGECRLPGVAATVQLSSQVDAHGRQFGLVHWPAADAYAVVLACSPAGFAGVDQEVCEDQVGQWAHWLGQLNTLEELVGATVVVETTPDSGQRLDRAMRRGRLPEVAPFVDAVEEQIRAGHQVGAPTLTCRVTLTLSARVSDDEQLDRHAFDTGIRGTRGKRGRRGEPRVVVRGTAEMAEQIGDLLPAWTGSLAATGAGAGVRPCTAQEIVDATRVAFDPSVAQDVEEAQLAAAAAAARRERISATSPGVTVGEPADDPRAAAVAAGTGLVWSQVGPTFHAAHQDRYEHDLSVSRTWQMRNPPVGVFYAETMRTVIAPHRDIPRKRVTFLFRPESPLASAQAADADVRKALFKATQGRRAKAGAQVELEAAQQTARQEAQGSPLVRVGILVTVTATQEVGDTAGPSRPGGARAGSGGQDLGEKLRRASRAVRSSLAAQARIGLRIPVGSQDMAFLTGLPLGLVPQQLARATGAAAGSAGAAASTSTTSRTSGGAA